MTIQDKVKSTFWEKFRQYTIVIAAHESIIGPPQELRDSLIKRKIKNVLFIAHPLLYLKEHYKDSSRYTLYKDGEVVKTNFAFHWRLPEIFLYCKDVLYTILWCLQYKGQIDIFFGADPLNALSGIILRKLGKVKRVVYYTIDYTPKRFDNFFINLAYHLIDKISCYFTDVNWLGTKRTVVARVMKGMSKNKMAKIVIVPDGSHSSRVKKKSIAQIDMNSLVYVGYILKKQGIDMVIKSLSEIKNKILDIKFIIVGKGPYLQDLQRQVADLKLKKIVEFRGFIQDDIKVQEILSGSGIGVAPYVEDRNSFTYYSTAGKPVLYLACGLPVIITDVPSIAREIHKRKAGIMIQYKKSQFVDAVLKILKNKSTYATYKRNAISFGESLDWSDIFEKGLRKTVSLI